VHLVQAVCEHLPAEAIEERGSEFVLDRDACITAALHKNCPHQHGLRGRQDTRSTWVAHGQEASAWN